MRPLALALLLGACGAPAPKPAAAPAVEPNEGRYRIPSRFDLPGASKEAPTEYSSELAGLDGRAMLRLLDANEVLRDDAVLVLAAKLDQSGRPKGAPYSWKPVDDALDALDILFASAAGGWRRWAVFELFSFACSETRGRITLDPNDAGVDARWDRCGVLREKGRGDADKLLAEAFERYEDDPAAPKWKDARASAAAARDRMIAAMPDSKPIFADAWKLADSITDAQLTVARRLSRGVMRREDVPAARRERLAALETSWAEHRVRAVWATMVPKIAMEMDAPPTAPSHGFKVAPVRLGWPGIPPR